MALTSVVLQTLSATYVDRIGRQLYSESAPLYDVIHSHLPNMERYEHYIDALVIVPAVGFCGMWLTGLRVDHMQCTRVMSIVVALRALTTLVTILPSPKAGGEFDSFGGSYTTIFSGHMATILVLLHFIGLEAPLVRRYKWVYSLPSALFIVAARTHYTIDVIVASFVVPLITESASCACQLWLSPVLRGDRVDRQPPGAQSLRRR